MTRLGRVALTGCAVAAALVGSGCSVNVRAGFKTPAAESTDTTAVRSDEQLVQDTNLTASDVPANWVDCCPQRFVTSSELHDASPCIDAATLAPMTAGHVRQFALDLDQNGMEKGHLMAIVRSAESAEAATRVNAVIQSPAYDKCVADGIQQDLRARLPADAKIYPSTVTTIDRHLPIAGSTRLVATRFTVNGTDHVHYADCVTLTAGRLRASLQFEAIEPAALGEQAWEQSVLASGELGIIGRAAAKLTQAAAV